MTKTRIKIDCGECPEQSHCCQEGVSLDLEEAKKILDLKIPRGKFYDLDVDDDFSSGFRVDTSLGSDPCSFLTPEGLCAIHKISYDLKPTPCKEFPCDAQEKDGLSADVTYLCLLYKQAKSANSKESKS
ncbi:YkgJ family cysteine cluster protein [Candidatus Omnitrophota bacterium]